MCILAIIIYSIHFSFIEFNVIDKWANRLWFVVFSRILYCKSLRKKRVLSVYNYKLCCNSILSTAKGLRRIIPLP